MSTNDTRTRVTIENQAGVEATIGSDGALLVDLKSGDVVLGTVNGAVADGAAASGAGFPVLVAGQDGTNVQSLLTDTSGRLQVVGGAADGAAAAGNPVLIGIVDGSGNVQTVGGDTSGIIGLVSQLTPADGVSATNAAGKLSTGTGSSRFLSVLPSYINTAGTIDTMRGDATRGAYVQDRSGYSASATFTPAASSHVTPDVVGGAQLFDLNAPASCVFEIQSASLLINNATIETTAWTLHLYSVTPPSALADDATFDIPSGDQASYLGFISLAQVVDYGSTLYIETHNIGKRVQLAASGDLFGYLVNGTTLTPGAVAHVVKIMGKVV